MKKLFLSLALLYSFGMFAQTSGTLTFTVDPVAQSGVWGADHYLAIWIEDATNGFVKTKLLMSDNHGISSHLGVWNASSSGNTVDASTGASYTNYNSARTISWDATDVVSTLVADGTYNIWVELDWSHGGDNTSSSFSFTKGSAADSQTPADETYFTGIIIDWVPDGVGVEDNPAKANIGIYPNPTKDVINIALDNINEKCVVSIENYLGAVVYKESVDAKTNIVKTIDLSSFSKGVYIVKVSSDKTILEDKFILE